MNYGRYFTLDLKTSQLVDGIAVFYYRGFFNDEADSNNKRDRYPIYVHMSSEGVSFHLHYIDTLGKIKEHSNSVILSLPISSNLSVKDNLTQNLIDIYQSAFPFDQDNDQDENIIYNISLLTMGNSEDYNNGITYSSLETFNIDYSRLVKQKDKLKDIVSKSRIDIIRKLFLDFLYDVEHSDVFHNAPMFEKVLIGLNENYFFRAIRNKAEYYYQRRLASEFSNKQNSLHNKQNKIEDSQLDQIQRDIDDQNIFIAEYYIAAEKRWVDTISDQRSDSTFNDSNGWFNSSEKEMDAVYTSLQIDSCYENKGKYKSKISSSSYRCADFISIITRPCEKEIDERSEYNKSHLNTYDNALIDTANGALGWYLQRYCFLGILKIWCGEKYKYLKYVLIALSILLIASLVSKDLSSIISPIDKDYIRLPLIIIIVLILIRLFVYLKDIRRMGKVGDVNIFMPRLLASIITAWFTLAIGEDIFKGFFDHSHNWIASGILTLVTFVFVFNEIGKLNKFSSFWKRFFRSLTLISMAFVYSLFAGVLIMSFFGETYIERSGYLSEFFDSKVNTNLSRFAVSSNRTHNLFYKTINAQDSTVFELINDATFVPPKKCHSTVLSHLNTKYPILEYHNIKVEYGLTLKLLSIFCNNAMLDDHEDMSTIIGDQSHQSSRVEAVRRYLATHNKEIGLTENELQYFHIHQMQEGINDYSFGYLLKAINDQTEYKESLQHLVPMYSNEQVAKRSIFNILIFREMLFQFAFFAMFIGVFLQLVFEENPVTKPI